MQTKEIRILSDVEFDRRVEAAQEGVNKLRKTYIIARGKGSRSGSIDKFAAFYDIDELVNGEAPVYINTSFAEVWMNDWWSRTALIKE